MRHGEYGRDRDRALAAEKSLQLSLEVEPDLPLGFGDDRRLAQVLLNLVGNAVKFTDQGAVRVGARRSDGQYLVSVADTGPGIPASDQQRVFGEFQQVDNSSTRMKGGTGLGLAIAKRMVEMHGGRLWVESDLGGGSTFYFTIPVGRNAERRPRVDRLTAKGHERSSATPRRAARKGGKHEEAHPDHRGPRGQPPDHARRARRERVRVLRGAPRKQALAIAEREKPDLILMDIQLPGIDGTKLRVESSATSS